MNDGSGRASVLVVEDERVIALDLSETLQDLGYDVVGVVSSSDEALAVVRVHRPDLALLDIRISGSQDGIEVAEVLREEFDVPAIFLTAHADDRTIERASQVNPFGYLVKPFEARALRSAVEVALRRRRMEASHARFERWMEAVLGVLEPEDLHASGAEPGHPMLLEDVGRQVWFPVRGHRVADGPDEWLLKGADGSVQQVREGVPFQVGDRTFRLRPPPSHPADRCLLRVAINGATGPRAEIRDKSSGTRQTWTAGTRVALLYVLARRVEEDRKAGVAEPGWCTDTEVAIGVWGREGVGRSLNVTVTRIRNDLRVAGFDPSIIEKRSGYVRLQRIDVQVLR